MDGQTELRWLVCTLHCVLSRVKAHAASDRVQSFSLIAIAAQRFCGEKD